MFDANFIPLSNEAIHMLADISVPTTLLITAYQIRINTKTSRASYWLELRKMFNEYNEIHKKLQLTAEWRNPDAQIDNEDIYDIIGYMGLFEHCYDMMRKGLIDKKLFKDIYSYRVHVIMNSPKIVTSTLVNSGRYWSHFRALATELGHYVPDRADCNIAHKQITYPVGWE